MTRGAWVDRAACAGDADLYDHAADGDYDAAELAKAICAACPVRAECLAAALAEEDGAGTRYGIRGGMSPHQRQLLAHGKPLPTPRKRRRREPAGRCPKCGGERVRAVGDSGDVQTYCRGCKAAYGRMRRGTGGEAGAA